MTYVGTRPSGSAEDLAGLIRDLAAGGSESSARVTRGRVGWERETGAEHLTITPGQDVEVHVTSSHGYPLAARLAAPGGVWRAPVIGEECLLIGPESDATTPGALVCFCPHRLPPNALTATRAVVEIPTGGALYVGNDAAHAAAREGDPVRVTIPAGTTFTGTVAGNPATFTTNAPVTCDGTIRDGSAVVKIA